MTMYVHKVGCVSNVGCIFGEVFFGSFDTEEALFEALAAAIEEARTGSVVEASVWREDLHWTAEDFSKMYEREKLNLLALCGNLTVTLTKKHCFSSGVYSQLRVWVRNPRFWRDGSHVDEYGQCGIFEAHGPFNQMKALAQQFLCKKFRQFEDEHYVVWL